MGNLSLLLEELQNPSAEFTPIPFWFFNDEPDEERIQKQLADYAEKGVNGIVLHPRIGLPDTLPYLSEDYFKWIRFIVAQADKLRMKIVLYDEGMYPSGSAHGMVVEENPDYASKGITIKETESVKESERVLCNLKNDRSLVYGFTGGTIRGIHFGEDDGEAGAPKSADILNPEAVDCFIRLTHERYYEQLKEYFGGTVIGFFTDEPCSLGRNAEGFCEWACGMERELAEEGGCLEELEGLFTGKENRTTAIYRKLIKKHLRETFYARLSKWCGEHGIAFMGHPAESDDVEEEVYFHIPGQDLVFRRVSPETGGVREPDSVQAKLTADMARLLGRRRNANECFGVCNRPLPEQLRKNGDRRSVPWYFTGRDMIWYINWLSFRGVNLFIPHAFYYSLEGARKEERPPDVGPGNIWWRHYRQISDYMKRLSYLMTDVMECAEVAVLCDNNRVPCAEVAQLYERQVSFRYLPAAFLERTLASPDHPYRVVLNVLGSEWDAVLEKYHVIAAHNAQEVIKGIFTSGKQQADRTRSYGSVLTVCPGLRAVKLIKYGVEMYFFSNEGKEEIFCEFRLPEAWSERKPEVRLIEADLWKGTYICRRLSEAAPGGAYPLKLAPCEVRLLILDADALVQETIQEQEPFLGDWTDLFVPVEQNKTHVIYERVVTVENPAQGGYFTLIGEEMAECFCNGEFVNFSLYSPHVFSLKGHLKQGENQIRIILTGNAANIYERSAGIPFGIGLDNG